jgi:hypothetical protein
VFDRRGAGEKRAAVGKAVRGGVDDSHQPRERRAFDNAVQDAPGKEGEGRGEFRAGHEFRNKGRGDATSIISGSSAARVSGAFLARNAVRGLEKEFLSDGLTTR